jgi:hypothetical protein
VDEHGALPFLIDPTARKHTRTRPSRPGFKPRFFKKSPRFQASKTPETRLKDGISVEGLDFLMDRYYRDCDVP